MAVCPEFSQFQKDVGRPEDAFVQRFLIPLLNRLGFSLVVNYHGRREFGRDLIFGEIDRFGHIRYNGLQAKFVSCVGLADSEDLVKDCKQAFTVDFVHPQTGAGAKISSFYAVNAGSISNEAAEYFFSAVRPIHADNVRLIDGRGLLTLDRFAAISFAEDRREILAGLKCEVDFDISMLETDIPYLRTIAAGDGNNVSYPPNRLLLNAVAAYLVRPILGAAISIDVLQDVWVLGTVYNNQLDSAISSPLQTVVSIKIPARNILAVVETQLRESLQKLRIAAESAMAMFGPLVAI